VKKTNQELFGREWATLKTVWDLEPDNRGRADNAAGGSDCARASKARHKGILAKTWADMPRAAECERGAQAVLSAKITVVRNTERWMPI